VNYYNNILKKYISEGMHEAKQGIDLIVFKGDVLQLDGRSCPDPLLVSSPLY